MKILRNLQGNGKREQIMSDFGDTSGVLGDRGYVYQKYYAIYCLVVDEAREIEYEADGEDITIINEDPSRNSVEYIQCKCHSAGSITIGDFAKDIFPQLWNAYSKANERYPNYSKAIYTRLVTNVALNKDMNYFSNLCISHRQNGLPPRAFIERVSQKRTINKAFQDMKREKNEDDFFRLLWGFTVNDLFSVEHIRDRIILYITECNITEPRDKLAKILEYFSKIGQGRITRRQIEKYIGCDLTRSGESVSADTVSSEEIKCVEIDLLHLKEDISPGTPYPNKQDTIKTYVEPTKRALRIIEQCGARAQNTNKLELTELCETASSDYETITEDASDLAEMEVQIWMKRQNISQRVDSLHQILLTLEPEE